MAAAGTSLYPPETVEAGFTALALANGNARIARENLAEQGIDVAERTLARWRSQPRYIELHEQRKAEIEQAAIRQWREITVTGAHAQLLATERAIEGMDDLDAKDASAVAKNLAIATGVAADKLLIFTDRPNQITQHREPEQILRQLESIVGSAEEITDSDNPGVALTAESGQSNARDQAAGNTSS